MRHPPFRALALNSLDIRFKVGFELKLKGIVELAISYTLKSFTGQTGGEMSAKALTIGAEYSNTSYSGNPMSNPETSDFQFTAGPYAYNPSTGESTTNLSTTIKAGLVIGLGLEGSFDVTKFNQQAAAAGCDVIQ